MHFLEQPLQTAGERQSSAHGGVHTQSCTRYNPIYSAGNAAVIIQREERFSRVQPEVSMKFPAALMELGTEIISPYKRRICAELFTILTWLKALNVVFVRPCGAMSARSFTCGLTVSASPLSVPGWQQWTSWKDFKFIRGSGEWHQRWCLVIWEIIACESVGDRSVPISDGPVPLDKAIRAWCKHKQRGFI